VAGNIREVTIRWTGELTFEGGAPARPPILVDGGGTAGISPVDLLLVAAASCSAADVVTILKKQHVGLRTLEVRVEGTRRETEPRRYTAIHFRFTFSGEGADETKARRAIDLSLEKYCSVVASLAPDIRVSYDVALR
jgi:putative redox protein